MSSSIVLPKGTISTVSRTLVSDAANRCDALIEYLKSKGCTDEQIEQVSELMVPESSEVAGLFKAGRPSMKRRKDPNAPKKSQTAYMLWLNANRAEIAATFDEELTGRDKVTKVAKKAGEMWKGLSEEEKQPFVDEAAEKREEYLKAKEEYSPSEPVYKTAKTDFTELPADEAPEGWTGPFDRQILMKFAIGRKMGVGKFNTFQEAVTEAERLSASGVEIGGITRDKSGYSLRKTTHLHPSAEGYNDVSWVFGSVTVVEPKKAAAKKPAAKKPAAKKPAAKKPAAKKPAAKKPAAKKKPAVVSLSFVGEPAIDVETKTFSVSEAAPEVVEESQDNDFDAETDTEEDTEEDVVEGDDIECELELSEVEIDGKDYYLDEKTGDIYDTETEEKIGTFLNDELTLN